MSDWYWCLDHDAVEPASGTCPPDRRMGPYPSREAAANWKEQVAARNDQWEAEDEAWEEGEQPA